MKIQVVIFRLLTVVLITFCIGCSNTEEGGYSVGSETEENIKQSSETTIVETPPNSSSLPDSSEFPVNDESEELTSVNLDEWLGKYLYIYSSNPDAPEPESDTPGYMVPRIYYHEILIYKEQEQYYATYSVEGPLVHFSLSTTIQVDCSEMCLLYESDLKGFDPSRTTPYEKKEQVLKLKMNEDGTLSIIRENSDASEAIFHLIDESDELFQ